jgi:hypothetical protein
MDLPGMSALVKSGLAVFALALLAACGGRGGAPVDAMESIELTAILESVGPLPVESVEYTVRCVGDEDSDAPDATRFDGVLEPANGRAAKVGMLDHVRETWAGSLELPPGSCSIQIRGRDGDGEVVCTAEVPFSVVANTATQVIVPLPCASPGIPLPREANRCPDLLELSCDDLDPVEASTSCVVRFRDSDDTCASACDPQSCTVSPDGLVCTPGPDPGVSTTITCTDGLLHCTGDDIPDPYCPIDANTSNTVSEIREGSFIAACVPPEPDSTVGMDITCTAVTTDGDLDCNKTKVIIVDCPDPS